MQGDKLVSVSLTPSVSHTTWEITGRTEKSLALVLRVCREEELAEAIKTVIGAKERLLVLHRGDFAQGRH